MCIARNIIELHPKTAIDLTFTWGKCGKMAPTITSCTVWIAHGQGRQERRWLCRGLVTVCQRVWAYRAMSWRISAGEKIGWLTTWKSATVSEGAWFSSYLPGRPWKTGKPYSRGIVSSREWCLDSSFHFAPEVFQNFIDQLIRWISKQWLWICPYFALAIFSGHRRESNESFGLLWNHPFSWLMFQGVQVKYLSYSSCSWVEIFQLHWHSHVWWQPQGINQHSIHIPWISHQYSTITICHHHFCWLSPLRKTEVTSFLWGLVMQRHGPKPVLAATLFGLLAGGILFPGTNAAGVGRCGRAWSTGLSPSFIESPHQNCLSWFGYGSIPIHTIFRGMNIHLPAILMWTTGVQGFDTSPFPEGCCWSPCKPCVRRSDL